MIRSGSIASVENVGPDVGLPVEAILLAVTRVGTFV